MYGQAKPTQNPWSWTNLSSVLYVEQPVGTGFSQGTPDIQNEDDLSAQLVGFFQQFLEVFTELKGFKLYLTGESVRISAELWDEMMADVDVVCWNVFTLFVSTACVETSFLD
jgi:carboxypeptidase C (cathepsin A)